MAEKATTVSEPKQTPANGIDKNSAGEAADKSRTLASASDFSILQVNYLADGDRNFIRAWPYE